jgi:hypothetical protein
LPEWLEIWEEMNVRGKGPDAICGDWSSLPRPKEVTVPAKQEAVRYRIDVHEKLVGFLAGAEKRRKARHTKTKMKRRKEMTHRESEGGSRVFAYHAYREF